MMTSMTTEIDPRYGCTEIVRRNPALLGSQRGHKTEMSRYLRASRDRILRRGIEPRPPYLVYIVSQTSHLSVADLRNHCRAVGAFVAAQ
jgi:hypothetical protein